MSEPTQPGHNPGQDIPGPGGQPGPGAAGYHSPSYPGTQGGANYPGQSYPPQPYPGQPGPPPGYGYPGSPYGQMAPPAEDPALPQQVKTAFWLLIGSAVLAMIAIPVTLAYLNSPEYVQMLETMVREAGLELDTAILSAGIGAGTASAIATGIFGLAIRVGLAFLVKAGFNWARIIITAFAGLSVFGLLGLFTAGMASGMLTLAAALATFAAVALLFMQPSNEYFARKKAFRQVRKFSGYQG